MTETEKFGMAESVDSKIKTHGESFIKITGEVISRYLYPGTNIEVPGSRQVDHNLVVDTGAIEIVKYLQGATTIEAKGAFKYMGIGTTATAAASINTSLTGELTGGTPTYARIVAPLTITTEQPAGTISKVFTAIATFAQTTATGSNLIREFGLFDSALAGTNVLFNRSVFATARDNENNDLEITYNCTVAPT